MNARDLAQEWLKRRPAPEEGVGLAPPELGPLATAVVAGAAFDSSAMVEVLGRLYRAAWTAGAQQGAAMLVGIEQWERSALAQALSRFDWTIWGPSSSVNATAPNLSTLITDARRWGTEIDGTTRDRLARVLAEYHSDDAGELARLLNEVVATPGRADVIATHEVNRAMSLGAMDTYAEAGIALWDWVTEEGACPFCLQQEAANPHRMGEAEPPDGSHVWCRCHPQPVR